MELESLGEPGGGGGPGYNGHIPFPLHTTQTKKNKKKTIYILYF